MRSPLGGSIATCLIFVPLVAVPLLAVLGMPQLATSKVAATGDDLKFAADETNSSGANADLLAPVRVSDPKSDAATVPRSARVKDADPFAEFSRDSDGAGRPATAAGATAKRTQRWTNEGNGLPKRPFCRTTRRAMTAPRPALPIERRPADRSTIMGPSRRARHAGQDARCTPRAARGGGHRRDRHRGAHGRRRPGLAHGRRVDRRAAQPGAASASRTALTWKRAIDRLNSLGIRDFQLQPGEREGDFNFSCRFASRHNPRVIHRFEAEAADPLEAVNQVLRQLDDWRARHLERNQGAHTASAESRPAPRAPESTEVEITNRAF